MSASLGAAECCWTSDLPDAGFEPLRRNEAADVVVVGGGICGLTAALHLAEEGRSVVVLEARRVGRQVTGRSTGKVTLQHRVIYAELVEQFGRALAKAYLDSNQEALELIVERCARFDIDCELRREPAYVYGSTAKSRARFEREAAAAKPLGLAMDVLESAPVAFKTSAALRLANQAQLNPARYLVGLARSVAFAKGRIHEQSRATGFEPADGRWIVEVNGTRVTARDLIMASHVPVKSPKGYAKRVRPRCHVAMAFRAKSEMPGMFIGLEEPSWSFRGGRDRDGPFVVVIGPHFLTGHEADVMGRVRELDAWARANLPVGDAICHWSNEDYDTPHRMPYVGEPDPEGAPDFHVGVGYNGWGITNGTAAGLRIARRIINGEAFPDGLYDPQRRAPPDFNPEGDTQSRVESVEQIAKGEGAVIEREGEPLAVHRDAKGALHAFSAKCTHKGCLLTWNNADGNWNCPCHGSMFEADGTVLHGPARKPLERRVILDASSRKQ